MTLIDVTSISQQMAIGIRRQTLGDSTTKAENSEEHGRIVPKKCGVIGFGIFFVLLRTQRCRLTSPTLRKVVINSNMRSFVLQILVLVQLFHKGVPFHNHLPNPDMS
jgi:hypothetical protein